MRLIDAAEAEKALAEQMAYEARIEYGGRQRAKDYLLIARAYFQNCPTIEAEPARRGRWLAIKEKAPWLVCSECGTYLYNEQKSVSKYCYNCGAKMKGEE